jgi:hypothetical protein
MENRVRSERCVYVEIFQPLILDRLYARPIFIGKFGLEKAVEHKTEKYCGSSCHSNAFENKAVDRIHTTLTITCTVIVPLFTTSTPAMHTCLSL